LEHSLRLTIWRDSDHTAELSAEVTANAFAGRGSAWFSVEQLGEFAKRLEDSYPLNEAAPLEIRGGFWDKKNAAMLEQEHIGISFYPIGGLGTVGCRVRLATPVHDHERRSAQHEVTVELKTTYEALRLFGIALADLAAGRVEEAVLSAADGR
jgi:hypothetical protein